MAIAMLIEAGGREWEDGLEIGVSGRLSDSSGKRQSNSLPRLLAGLYVASGDRQAGSSAGMCLDKFGSPRSRVVASSPGRATWDANES